MKFDEELLKRFGDNERFSKTLQIVYPIFKDANCYISENDGIVIEFSLRHGIFGVSCELNSAEDGWWACYTKQNPTKKWEMSSGFIDTLKENAENWATKLKG